MDWDMKLSSSTGHWDWDNSILFSFRPAAAAADIGKKPQYVGHCSDSHTEVLDNGFVYSAAPAPDSTLASASAAAASVGNLGYVSSSSRSSVSVDYYPPNSASAASSVDLCKIKVEAPSEPVADATNAKFLDIRSSTTTGSSQGTSSSRRTRTAAGAEDSSLSEKTSGNGKKAAEEELQQRGYATILDSKGKESAASKEDTQLSLKLGKRTYFEDTSASAAVFVSGSANKSNSSSSASSVAAASVTPKKHRGSSQANQTPRCQVEGCNKDLSSCREYHRRHKVCELHSKSARVIVAGIEQRFCQQCSRFHVLSEFDDGKRSCRRRLAGHNERRRKPPADNMSLSSMRLAASTFDGRRPGLLIDRSALIHSCNFRLGQGKVIWPRVVKAEDLCNLDSHYPSSGVNRQFQCNPYSRPNADRLLQMFQTSRIGTGDLLSQSVHHYNGPATNQLPQSLTLATSTGPFSGIEVAPVTNSLQGVTESGRALSLLSNHFWGPSLRAPGSSSLDLASRPGIAMEHQYPHVNHSSIGLVSAEHPPSALNFMEKIPNGSSLANGILGIGNFESPVYGFRTGDDFKNSHEASSKDARCTIDLMHRSSQVQGGEPQGQSAIVQHSNGHFMEFQLMRSYESSVFETQQM